MDFGDPFLTKIVNFRPISANFSHEGRNYRPESDDKFWKMVISHTEDTVETLIITQGGFNGK